MSIATAKLWSTGIDSFPDVLRSLVARYPNADILELGGGRRPSFGLDEMPSNLNSYTVNDISQDELALAPAEYGKACFDVSGDVSNFERKYDVVFSRFLAEHVRDGRAMHRNVLATLKPGGVAFHLIPTLYSSPFIINRLLPETLTRKALTTLFPIRKTKSPKFPAYYSMCFGNIPKMRNGLRDMGYSQIEISNFYDHYYYERVPVLREIETMVSSVAAKRDWGYYASYAHVIAYR